MVLFFFSGDLLTIIIMRMYVSWMWPLIEHVKASTYQTGDVADCPEFEVREVKSRISLQMYSQGIQESLILVLIYCAFRKTK